ncbi:AfsR/SARP family transcriptional regulator [Nonomuraea fuscirosea]|uniref:AfsR/SARP family transcriptional regulator n=1 Tax=Nonomuraea fuscirosea TaxID=1291556 RepID=UPI00344458ED
MRERLGALAMRALAASGRQAEALELYERTRRTLADELEVDPGDELRAAHLAVVSGAVAGSSRGVLGSEGNVRVPRTRLIGREAELEQLSGLLAEARLVTVVGPGGAGKTRLATEVALRMSAGGLDGVWMVEPASVGEPEGVAGVLLGAFGLREDRRRHGDRRGRRTPSRPSPGCWRGGGRCSFWTTASISSRPRPCWPSRCSRSARSCACRPPAGSRSLRLSRDVTAAMAGFDEHAAALLATYAAGDDLWLPRR